MSLGFFEGLCFGTKGVGAPTGTVFDSFRVGAVPVLICENVSRCR